MIRSIVMHEIPRGRIAAIERRYYQVNGPEFPSRYDPRLTRHKSCAPADAPEHGFNWSLTDVRRRDLLLSRNATEVAGD